MSYKKTRREFIELGAKTGIVLPFLPLSLYNCKTKKEEKAKAENTNRKLKMLILGGTSFLGPHQIAYAIGRGHAITTFTRGKTKPTIYQNLFEQVESLIGDRNDDLTALHNRKWDAVIDNSGHNAEWTKKSAALLKENCELYLYTSSTGVYYPYLDDDYKEDAEVLLSVPEGIDEEQRLEYGYGVMKANSEKEAKNQFGLDRTIVVRPTYMIGPSDRTNRSIHWPVKLSKGGEVMIPGKSDDRIQYLDVRDAAEWMIRLIEDKKIGTFNAVGPREAQNMYEFVEEAKKTFDVDTSFVKIDDYDFLKENNVHYIVPWIMPVGNNRGSAKISNTKAKRNGLTFRPLTESVKATYDWWYSDAVTSERREKFETDPKSTLNREKSIIEKWKAL